ncbi:iron ABC transporter substrate-binding protein [Bacillus timonensis]|uniref:Iron ABC transporter substrate-binding protein n=1 Tax=Bacillus timonensis TaxID=1033734 RepID=A0A4S3PL39_9BACI|nr:ABC transporter substrate-binding protein [Bacillus timonensis]THE09854.1 iron ABC transporter substrate-binding protein [Bacillus timonensis]
MKKLVFLMLLMLVLAGCGAQKEDTATKPTEDSLIIDNYGREVEIPEKPSKVLTLGPNATELFIALGLSDYVIGNSLDNHSRGSLPEYAEEYDKIPELTYGSATREAVLTSGADFIYGIDWEFGSEGLDVDELESYGIKVYMNKATTMEEIYQEILDLGKIFEIEERAEAFVAEQKERIAEVQEKLVGQEPVNVLVYDSGGNGVFTAGGTNFETLLIELAGGRNVFEDITDKQWATVSYEEVLARKPDVILIHDYDAPSIEQKMKDIKNDPALSQLESVKNENFVVISLESVLPGNRMAYAVESLAEGFYPEVFN